MSEMKLITVDPEQLMNQIMDDHLKDDEPSDVTGAGLIQAYQGGNEDVRKGIDEACLAFTGWTFESLVHRAGGSTASHIIVDMPETL
jgi:hypothetical protein